MIELTVAIVTYDGLGLLRDCLGSIDRAGIGCAYEIVIVDNGSTDGTLEWLRRERPDVRVIANAANRGVAAGNNQCFAHGRGRYVLLLNNDTLVQRGMVDRMAAFADTHPRAGAVGGKLVNRDGSFQASHLAFPTLWSELKHATRLWALYDPGYPSRGEGEVAGEVDWIPSACLLVRAEAARAVGGVDEAYFMYSDETDLQYRLKKAGWEIYYLDEVATIHLGGRSASHWRRRRMIYRGKLLFFRKHYGRLRTWSLRAVFGLASLLKVILWTAAAIVPRERERARNEARSNAAIVRMSLSPSLDIGPTGNLG